MSVPHQRRGEPAWCNRHLDGHTRRHLSEPVTGGNQYDRGQVTGWLIKADGGPTTVMLNAAHAASVAIDLSLEDAAQWWREFGDLLRRAGVEL